MSADTDLSRVLHELEAMRAELGALRTLVADLRPAPRVDVGLAAPTGETTPHRPLTTWRAIADAVGVSEDTLHRHRQRTGDSAPAYFLTLDDAQAWWAYVRYGVRPKRRK